MTEKFSNYINFTEILFCLHYLPIIIIDGGLMWGLTSPHMGPHFLIRIPAQKA